ncbi:hypothetical protein EGR_08375 [Echinococcus granulosus]|uniref:Uncharacterized protein n=1 Tax=Echinococcus granulosus TaxID=6210 RepID=W6UF71_ECHGR|nr:hypothetical protein EGR_08375 [Echinococcus granulosus]EUB56797.1 hypothetical protein EGR_08375 [Echinococcus granulosus]
MWCHTPLAENPDLCDGLTCGSGFCTMRGEVCFGQSNSASDRVRYLQRQVMEAVVSTNWSFLNHSLHSYSRVKIESISTTVINQLKPYQFCNSPILRSGIFQTCPPFPDERRIH